MKKRILSLFLLLSVLCLAACQSNETPRSSAPQIFYYSDHFGTAPINDELIDWDDENDVYQDATAPRVKTISFLGQSYEATYVCSYEHGLANITVHMYFNFNDNIAFTLDAKAGNVIGLAGFPYSYTATSESQYRMECVKILGPHYVKTYTCQYRSTTKYKTIDSQGTVTEHSVNGFYTPTDADQITERSFYFEKYIDGIKTYEQYCVTFDEEEQTIIVKTYDCDYTRGIFDKRSSIDMESVIDEYLATHIKANKELGGYRWRETMFVKDSIPYSLIDVYFESGDWVGLFVKH